MHALLYLCICLAGMLSNCLLTVLNKGNRVYDSICDITFWKGLWMPRPRHDKVKTLSPTCTCIF